MIELHVWPTPNGLKISIMLEECNLPYKAIPVDIRIGDQFKPDFLKISPNNKIPAIIDTEGPDGKAVAVFESGAILMYLADKCGLFLPKDTAERYQVIQWLFFQMASVGPMFGQFNHFTGDVAPELPYAINRYANESNRLMGVIDRRLQEASYIAGDYSIADMAIFPWVRSYTRKTKNLGDFPNAKRWFNAVDARPAVKRGLELLATEREAAAMLGMTDQAREILYGSLQYQRR